MRDIEGELRNRLRQEVRSSQIGELALRRLKEIDPVAYVRFASVYRAFADVDEFEDELARLEREPPLPRGQYPLDDQLFETLDAGASPARPRDPHGPARWSRRCRSEHDDDHQGATRWRLTRRPR